jgi:DNA-binding response OmpR family regulator
LLVRYDAEEAAAHSRILEHAGVGFSVVSPGDTGSAEMEAFDAIAIGAGASPAERLEMCRRLRAHGFLGAIIVVDVDPGEVGALLESGADDFILSPIRGPELLLRLQMKRSRGAGGARRAWSSLEIDVAHRIVFLRGRLLPLTSREYNLIACLLDAGGEVVSRGELLSKVWARGEAPGSNLLDVQLSRLREKLRGDADLIETVRGAGYRLRRPPSTAAEH